MNKNKQSVIFFFGIRKRYQESNSSVDLPVGQIQEETPDIQH
jgi:hypothetical protein